MKIRELRVGKYLDREGDYLTVTRVTEKEATFYYTITNRSWNWGDADTILLDSETEFGELIRIDFKEYYNKLSV